MIYNSEVLIDSLVSFVVALFAPPIGLCVYVCLYESLQFGGVKRVMIKQAALVVDDLF